MKIDLEHYNDRRANLDLCVEHAWSKANDIDMWWTSMYNVYNVETAEHFVSIIKYKYDDFKSKVSIGKDD